MTFVELKFTRLLSESRFLCEYREIPGKYLWPRGNKKVSVVLALQVPKNGATACGSQLC